MKFGVVAIKIRTCGWGTGKCLACQLPFVSTVSVPLWAMPNLSQKNHRLVYRVLKMHELAVSPFVCECILAHQASKTVYTHLFDSRNWYRGVLSNLGANPLGCSSLRHGQRAWQNAANAQAAGRILRQFRSACRKHIAGSFRAADTEPTVHRHGQPLAICLLVAKRCWILLLGHLLDAPLPLTRRAEHACTRPRR